MHSFVIPQALFAGPQAKQFAQLPLQFEENVGQFAPEVKYVARGPNYTVFIRNTDSIVQLLSSDPSVADKPPRKDGRFRGASSQKSIAALRFQISNAATAAPLSGEGPLPGKVNYFVGRDPSKWRTNVPSYRSVLATRQSPGIDVRYLGNQRQLQYDILVAPGSSPHAVEVQIDGAQKLDIESSGDLLIGTRVGTLRQRKPLTYQVIGGVRREVPCRYKIVKKDKSIGFELGSFDPTATITIDPTLLYATYLGGSQADRPGASSPMAVDASGNVLLTGSTASVDLPVTSGVFQPNPGQNISQNDDAFVAKIDATGTSRLYVTYLGGEYIDRAHSIALDAAGNAVVAGETLSVDFPLFQPFDGTFSNRPRAFVTKLSTTGSSLIFSTYFGSSTTSTWGTGVALDQDRNVCLLGFIAGEGLPVANAIQPNALGSNDLFVAKLNPDCSQLIFSTYLGGQGNDGVGLGPGAIATDQQGNVYVTGTTNSSDFPVKNAYTPTLQDFRSATLTKFAPNGQLIYSTYFPAFGVVPHAIAVDADQFVYVAGEIASGSYPFTNPFSTTQPSAFLAKIKPDCSGEEFSTSFGGETTRIFGLALDTAKRIYLTGATSNPAFPLVDAIDSTFTETTTFISTLNASGSALDFSTVYGDGAEFGQVERGAAISVDPSGNVYVLGETTSSTSPISNPLQPFGGVLDVWLATFAPIPRAPTLHIDSVQPEIAGRLANVTINVTSDADLASLQLLIGGQQATLTTNTSRTFVFNRVLQGSEGSPNPEFKLIGRTPSGQISMLSARPLTTDFTPPIVTNITATPNMAREGTPVEIRFTASEVLQAAPAVTVGGQTATPLAVAGLDHTYSVTISSAAGEGSPPVTVSARDLAGNEVTTVGYPLTTDFVTPVPTSITAAPSAGRRGTDVVVSFGVTEAGIESSSVTLSDRSFVLLGVSSGRYTFARSLDGTEPEGSFPTRISLSDSAGNSSTTTGPVVRTDFTTPTAAITISPARATIGTTVTVRVAVNEDLAQPPSVRLGGVAQTLSSTSALLYEYSTPLAAQVTEGPVVADVVVTDLVGNSRTVTRTDLVADYTAPRFDPVTVSRGPLDPATPSAAVQPRFFSVGAEVVVTFVASEELRDAVVDNGAFRFVRNNGLVYVFSRELDGSEGSGTHVIPIRGTDLAGNTATVTTANYTADFDAPTVSEISATPSPATRNQEVTVRFRVSEPLGAPPVVQVGGLSATQVTSAANVFTFSRRLDGTEPQGDVPVSINVVDMAGNQRTDTSGHVLLNFEAPHGVITPFPTPALEGTPITLSALGSSDASGITSATWSVNAQVVSTAPIFSHVLADGPTTATIDLVLTNSVGLSSSTRLLLPVRNVSPTVVVKPLAASSSGLTTITWVTTEPGVLDAPRATIVALDLITQLRTELVADVPDLQKFTWDTRGSKESSFQIFVTLRDKDGGQGSGASSPVIVDNLPLQIATSGPQPKFFNPHFGEPTALTYTLSEHARPTVRLIRSSDRSVIGTVYTTSALTLEGAHSALWDGKNPITDEIVPDGEYGYSVEAVDLLGSRATASSLDAGIVVVLDTMPPAPPTVDPIAALTRTSNQLLVGTKEPGSGIRLLRGSTLVVDGTPDDTATWSANITLAEGQNTLTFLARDRAGNLSTSIVRTSTLDTTPPPAPVITSTIPDPTQLNTLTIAGTKEADSSLIVTGVVRSATPSTAWSEDFNLRAGTNYFKFEARDPAGNTSAATLASTFRTPNPVATPTLNTSLTSRFTTIAVAGTKQAGTDVTIRNADTGVTFHVDPSPLSTWTVALSLPREERNQFVLLSEDSIGSQSAQVPFTVLLDSQPPLIALPAGLTATVTTTASVQLRVSYADQPKPPDSGGAHFLSGINVATAKLLFDGVDITSQCTVTATGITGPSNLLTLGAHRIDSSVADNAGNVASVSGQFYLIPPDNGSAPQITLTRLVNTEFTPAYNAYEPEHLAKVRAEFSVDTPVTGYLVVTTSAGTVVATTEVPQCYPNQTNSVVWNGRNAQLTPVIDGEYKLQISVTNIFGRTTNLDPIFVQVIY